MRAFTSILGAISILSPLVQCRALTARSDAEVDAPLSERSSTWSDCLTPADADHLVNGYAKLINSTFSSTLAQDILASDFIDYSDSINFLAGVPLSYPIFKSLAAFDGSQSQQLAVPLQVLSIDAVSCTNIAWRWLAYPGSGQYEVKGINIIYAVQGNGTSHGWQIGTNFAEFNSAAWNLDIGGTCVPPSAPAKLFK